jgi:hypothetical protein
MRISYYSVHLFVLMPVLFLSLYAGQFAFVCWCFCQSVFICLHCIPYVINCMLCLALLNYLLCRIQMPYQVVILFL